VKNVKGRSLENASEKVGGCAPAKGVMVAGIQDSREVRVRLGAKGLRFGIWGKECPTWARFVGISGDVRWMVGKGDVPVRNPRDTKFWLMGEAEIERLAPVDVVLFQGMRPGLKHGEWRVESVRMVVWLNQGFRGGERLPKGWTLTRELLSYARAGGVTNAELTVYVG
jgi:hypothetical protein